MDQEKEFEEIKQRLAVIEKALGIEQPPVQQQHVYQQPVHTQQHVYQPPVYTQQQQPVHTQQHVYTQQQPQYQQPVQPVYPPPVYSQQKSKWTEAIVGKYLVGIIASLLIFAAAISLVIMLWDSMNDLIRFMIIFISGSLILISGFLRLHKNKTAIAAILIGTGAGLVFIAIAAGHIAFNILDELTTITAILIWSAGLLLSFKLSKLFFTSVIAYAGGLIAFIFLLSRISSTADVVISLVFMVLTLGLFLVSTSLWMDKLKQFIAGVMAIALPFSFITAFAVNRMHTMIPDTLIFWSSLICSAVTYGIYFYIKHSIKDCISGIKSVALEITALLAFYFLAGTFLNTSYDVYAMSQAVRSVIMTCILAAVLFFMYRHTIVSLLTFILAAVMTLYEFNEIAFQFPVLGVLVFASFFLKDARFNSQRIVTLCLTCYCFLGILTRGAYYAYDENIISNLVYISGTICTVAVAILLIYDKYSKGGSIVLIKFMKTAVFIITAVLVPMLFTLIVPHVENYRLSMLVNNTILLSLMTLISVMVFYSGFFLDWRYEGAFPYKNSVLKRYSLDVSGMIVFGLMFVLYIASLITMTDSSATWYLRLTLTLVTLGVLALLTYTLFGRFRKNPFAAVVIGVMFLVFSWVFLYSWVDLGVGTLIASITGMALAFVSIYAGFILRIKALRLYGLVLTILMTVKAITFDLSGSDGVTRVVALLIGGVICFGISIVYTKLENSIKQNQNAVES